MNFLDAMDKVRAGQPVRRPRWTKLMVIWNPIALRYILDEEDGPAKNYKPVKADRKAVDWVEVDMTDFNRTPEEAIASLVDENLNSNVIYRDVP